MFRNFPCRQYNRSGLLFFRIPGDWHGAYKEWQQAGISRLPDDFRRGFFHSSMLLRYMSGEYIVSDSTLTAAVAGNTIIRVLPPNDPLPETDAIVEEQDTYLLLGITAEINDTAESYPSLVGRMEKQQPLVPGSILIRSETPKRIVAIIHDIDQKPICRDEWIATALQKILDECGQLKIHTLLMPVLGKTHGNVSYECFRELLDAAVLSNQIPGYPKKIYVLM